ncbi:thioredoxin domain-containing protein [Methylosinus sp. H3A]|uniref:DsbA family protein n=1 Tax=Methylosinus sp. H3A TaxID=2785786 RepID=UPI0018C2D257|nr:DsbA family protein [Methylosinus sp. H3A]MBG0808666.1 thioredoxin domain-containing protein [Methylosinus sp. H3A]
MTDHGPIDALSRRLMLGSLLGAVAAKTLLRPAQAQEDGLYPLAADDGKPVANYKLPSEFSPSDLPGIVWHGSKEADVVLVEFFDYNCPYCRKAAADLDALVSKDKNLRLGLANNAVLGLGSFLTARVQQAVLRLYGPERAYAFHKQLFAHRGSNDGVGALSVAKTMGLDASAIEASANSDMIGGVVKRHIQLAADLGFVASPSFALSSVGIVGYPGPKSIARMVAASRKCDAPACG